MLPTLAENSSISKKERKRKKGRKSERLPSSPPSADETAHLGPAAYRLQLNQNGLFLMVFYTDKWPIIPASIAVRELKQILR